PTDFGTLVQRDHVDLQKELGHLLDPVATPTVLNDALDGVRLGLTAHAEAEDIVLGRFASITEVAPLIGRARAAHLAQEGALAALVSARPGTTAWRDRAMHLRDLVRYHAEQEERELLPALRNHAPTELYAKLAGAFATERLRQLSMLQPSAPLYFDTPRTEVMRAEVVRTDATRLAARLAL
ncbi:MAG TPA: hemerythrin domain-containing protein, partial [Kofleriaceae bacterium]|nr:hemerythrin domain-containing protein [Kofleriaceae bacterium]